MKKFRSILCILLAVVMVLSFAACGKKTDDKAPADDAADNKPADDANKPADGGEDKPDDGESAPPSAAPGDGVVDTSVALQDTIITSMDEYENRPEGIQPGTEITYVMMNDTPAYVPWNASAEGFLYANIFEGLLYSHLGAVDDIRGNIAETWEHSDDYLTWTFKIREGVKFTDGTVCDAPAMEKCWDYHYEMSPTSITNYNIATWEATGDLEFVVTLSAPCAYFENALAGNSLVAISPTACETYGTDNNGCAVGTAPYYVEEYVSGVGMTLKANPNYHLEEKRPHIETINYVVIKDNNTLMMALLNGDVDGAATNDIEIYYNLMDAGYTGNTLVCMSNVNPMYINAKQYEPFQIYEVRETLARFLDFEAINQLVYDGFGIVQTSLWALDTSGYVFTDDYYYDPEEGHELLASVGLAATDLGFFATTLESSENYFVSIQNQLLAQGINMEIEIIEAAANFTYLMNGEWTVTVGSNAYTNATPYSPWTFILTPDAMIKQIWCDVYDPDLYNTMLDEYAAMISSSTWEEMLTHCRQLTTYAQDDHAAVLGIQRPGFVILNAEYKNAIYYTNSQYIMLYYLYV